MFTKVEGLNASSMWMCRHARNKYIEHFEMADDNGNITSLSDNDVLLGRGLGYARYVGNKRFLRLVRKRKMEYKSIKSYNAKAQIAKDVYRCLKKRNGRFLKLVETGQRARNVVRDGIWREASRKDALEKCKQALREKRDRDDLSDDDEESDVEDNPGNSMNEEKKEGEEAKAGESDESVTGLSSLAAELPQSSASFDDSTTSETPLFVEWDVFQESLTRSVEESTLTPVPVWAPSVAGGSVLSSVDVHHLSLFQHILPRQPMAANLAQHYMAPNIYQDTLEAMEPLPATYCATSTMSPWMIYDMDGSAKASFANAHNPFMAESLLYSAQQQAMPLNKAQGILKNGQNAIRNVQTDGAAVAELSGHRDSVVDTRRSDAALSESFLSAIGLGSDQPRFTEQDEQAEQAMLTDEEKATALSDLFGDMCSVTSHQKKRPKREFDGDTLAFFVSQMRAEIERIPDGKKQALLEAQEKCREDEFSDSRLERFLPCEGMNVKVSNGLLVHFTIHHIVGP